MKYKLVCFDLDGTLVENTDSSWDTIHKSVKTPTKERDENKRKYFAGEIGWEEWASLDLRIWQRIGVTRKDIENALTHLRLFPGAIETVNELKKKGLKVAIVSGALRIVLEKLIPDHERLFDYIYISDLKFNPDGSLKEFVHPPHIGGEKETALLMICKELKVTPEQTVFVGDNHNDVHALKRAGLGIAFCTKRDDVRKAANISVDERDLRTILPLIFQQD